LNALHTEQPRRAATCHEETLRDLPSATAGGPARFGGRVMVIADGENLSFGLRRHGFDLDFARLRGLLAARCGRVHAHAFATVPNASARDYAESYFARAGWQHHVRIAERVRTVRGLEFRANSDPDILLGCGQLASLMRPDAVVLATGDGDLGCDMARFLKSGRAQPLVIVCSMRGATSRRLHASVNADIDANLWLGWDCVGRIH
jgi:hypothetical protein